MGIAQSKVYPYKVINLNDYWIGPYGIIISNHINRVKDPDRTNFVLKPGNIKTNAPVNPDIPPLSKDEYLAKYGTIFPKNKYYFILSEENLKECDEYFIMTIKDGEKRFYKIMLNGEVFLETPHYTKTIYPINPATKKPVIP
jgi:hypothetical protein